MESRSISMSSTSVDVQEHIADGMRQGQRSQIGQVVADWQKAVGAGDDAAICRIRRAHRQVLRITPTKIARLASEVRVRSRPRLGRQRSQPARAAKRSISDLEKLAELYANRASRVYAAIDSGIDETAVLAQRVRRARRDAGDRRRAGDFARHRASRSPPSPRVTEAVAAGDTKVAVPFSERRDEIGALARSIGVFQRAMRKNEELNRTVADDAETRTRRQEQMSDEIARFSAEVEATLAELGRISDQMLAASTQLAGAADDASAKTDARGGRLRRKPPPTCATSLRPPTNCRPR